MPVIPALRQETDTETKVLPGVQGLQPTASARPAKAAQQKPCQKRKLKTYGIIRQPYSKKSVFCEDAQMTLWCCFQPKYTRMCSPIAAIRMSRLSLVSK